MNKLILCLIAIVVLFQFCNPSKKMNASHAAITYTANIQPLIIANCTPCHIPPKGFKKAYNTYDAVKGDIDEILRRANLNPGDRGFMPFKHSKLPDSTILVLSQWKAGGLKEN